MCHFSSCDTSCRTDDRARHRAQTDPRLVAVADLQRLAAEIVDPLRPQPGVAGLVGEVEGEFGRCDISRNRSDAPRISASR
jgi:hypothetical protein